MADREKKYLTPQEEIVLLREERDKLRSALEESPIYLAALTGIVLGQVNIGADSEERSRMAHGVVQQLKNIGKETPLWTSDRSRTSTVPPGES